jgi:hypothetical protein
LKGQHVTIAGDDEDALRRRRHKPLPINALPAAVPCMLARARRHMRMNIPHLELVEERLFRGGELFVGEHTVIVEVAKFA